jgi:hypothetical protein
MVHIDIFFGVDCCYGEGWSGLSLQQAGSVSICFYSVSPQPVPRSDGDEVFSKPFSRPVVVVVEYLF